MRDVVYTAADGLQVTLYFRTWRDHIQQRHPEVMSSDIERALTNPIRLCDHREYPDQQVYEGHSGTTIQGGGIFPVVIVERLNDMAGSS